MQKVASLIISIYIAAFLYTNVFFIKALTVGQGADQLFWNHLAVLLILVIPIFFVINKLVIVPRGISGPLKMVLLPLALAGLIIALLYHLIPLDPIYNLPAQVDKFFAPEVAFTAWLIVPLIALFI